MADKVPTKIEILSVVEAQTETLDSLSERIVKLEGQVSAQETRNNDMIKGVLVAVVLLIAAAVYQNISSDQSDSSKFNTYLDLREKDRTDQVERISNLEIKSILLENKIDLIKAKNTYLK